MPGLVHSRVWTEGGPVGFEIEGTEIGADTTLILTDMAAGKGPRLHKHPYPEVWVIHSGAARFTAGTETIDAGPGDIVHVEPEMPHKFVVTEGPAKMVCIHTAARFHTDWLE
jgi:mannose-6-phosphate isomerase-like protein (cupin superfamily)